MKDELQDVVAQELDQLQYDLVEFRRGGTKTRPVIEVRIDRRDAAAVTVSDCTRASRALEARLDQSGLVSAQYELQVSSPGERPLRSPNDWRRFTGSWANVLSPEHGGRMEGKILGLEGEPGAEVVLIDLGTGQERRIPLADVKEARLAFHW